VFTEQLDHAISAVSYPSIKIFIVFFFSIIAFLSYLQLIDGDKFSVAAVARCTSMVKSPTENYYKLDATIAQNNEICRVVGQSSVESQQ